MDLNFKKYGQGGHPLIILHGLFGSLDNWHTLADAFGKTFTVYAIDQRNHGRSPHKDTFNYQVLAEDLLSFLKMQNIENPYILGHSMGGKTAMHFALEYPEKLSRLIVADMAPKTYAGGHDEILDALQEFPVDKVKSRNEADKILSEKLDNFGIRQFLLKNLERAEQGGYKWKMNLPVLIAEYSNILQNTLPEGKKFEKPTLFLRGGKSGYIQDKDEDLLKRYFPKAEIATIKGAGHWLHAEEPEEFFEKVKSFLTK